nr:isoprenylcysteine carboxylmethyltransferase family protein [Fodinibius salsisoli]
MWLIDAWLVIESLKFEINWWLYVVLVLLGFGITFIGVRTFRKQETTTHPQHPKKATALVQSGIYRYTRNPMYLGMLLMLFSGIFYFGNWMTIIVLPFFVWYMNIFQIIPEEQALQQKFGAPYQKYYAEVRRWI